MRLFNNHSYTNRLPMKGKVKKGFRTYCAVVIAVMLIVSCFTVTAFAADGNGALSAVNNLSTFIFGLIRAIGLILTGFGVVQIGLSLKSHDPSQRANGFLTLAERFSYPCGRCHHHLCKGNPQPHYRLLTRTRGMAAFTAIPRIN